MVYDVWDSMECFDAFGQTRNAGAVIPGAAVGRVAEGVPVQRGDGVL